MAFDPMDPFEFYSREYVRGRSRINFRAITRSANVVEFQPYVLQYNYETYGHDTTLRVYEHFLENGYRKT